MWEIQQDKVSSTNTWKEKKRRKGNGFLLKDIIKQMPCMDFIWTLIQTTQL